MERRPVGGADLLSKLIVIGEIMKKIFGVCYKIGLIGEIIGLLFAIYTTSCSEQFSVLFSIITVPFTVIFACAIFACFKLPMEERPKPTRTWAVVHHPIGQFATLLTINVLLILVAQNQANSHAVLIVAGGYIGVMLILYIWFFKVKQ